jgi:hypothetical protein
MFIINNNNNTMEKTMTTREKLRTAILQCAEQEKHVEIFQLTTLLSLPDDWASRASLWCQQAIHQFQTSAVMLDGLLESIDEGRGVEDSCLQNLTILPKEYYWLIALEKGKHNEPKKWFYEAIESGDVMAVDLLVQELLIDPSVDYNWAIRRASNNGHLAIVNRLLQEPLDPRVDPSAWHNHAFRMASYNGHLAIVNRLLQDVRVNPSDVGNEAIRDASENGHLAVVDRLLQDPRVNPSANNNSAFIQASANGHLAVVDRLLQDTRVNPSADLNSAIIRASANGHLCVVDTVCYRTRVWTLLRVGIMRSI